MDDYLIAGIVLGVLTALSMTIVIVINPFIKKISNTYWYWLVIGVFILTYMIVIRFAYDFQRFHNLLKITNVIGGGNSLITSKALLLDLCPFAIFSIGIFLILDPTRKLASIIAPFGLFGGMITTFAQIMSGDNGNASLTAKYIFLGDNGNEGYFILHYLLCVIGCAVLANAPNHKWWGFLYEHIFAILYFGYLCIMVFVFKVNNHTTGVSENDWLPGGEYENVSYFLNLDYPFSMIVGYFLSYLGIFIIFWSWFFIQKCFKPYYINPKFNKRKWYLGWYVIN